MVDMKWEDPPVGAVAGKWSAAAKELRAHPGRWALIATKPNRNLAGNIGSGHLASFDAGQFEASSRINAEGTFDIYARYIGDA